MTKRRKLISALSVAGVLAAGVAALLLLTSFKAEAVKAEVVVEARLVETRALEPASQRARIVADGFLEPARSLDLYSPVAGTVELSRGGLKGGTAVTGGDVILALDDRRAVLDFENARTEMIRLSSGFVTSAGLSAEEKDVWTGYLARLGGADYRFLPAMPAMTDRQALLAATLGVTAARNAMETAALDLADHRVVAPFDGTLSGDGVPVGARVAPGVPLATLMEIRRMELPLSLPTDDLAFLSVGDAVVVIRPEDGAEAEGTIVRIEPALLAGSQTARVHAALDVPADAGWMPGAFVKARIEGSAFDAAYRVPRGVLVDGRLPVYRDGELVLMPVTVLAHDASDVLLAPDFPAGTEMVETVLQSPIEGLPLRKGADS